MWFLDLVFVHNYGCLGAWSLIAGIQELHFTFVKSKSKSLPPKSANNNFVWSSTAYCSYSIYDYFWYNLYNFCCKISYDLEDKPAGIIQKTSHIFISGCSLFGRAHFRRTTLFHHCTNRFFCDSTHYRMCREKYYEKIASYRLFIFDKTFHSMLCWNFLWH